MDKFCVFNVYFLYRWLFISFLLAGSLFCGPEKSTQTTRFTRKHGRCPRHARFSTKIICPNYRTSFCLFFPFFFCSSKYYYEKRTKSLSLSLYYICVSYYMISLSPENVLSAVKNWRRPVNDFCRKLFQILRKFMFDTY